MYIKDNRSSSSKALSWRIFINNKVSTSFISLIHKFEYNMEGYGLWLCLFICRLQMNGNSQPFILYCYLTSILFRECFSNWKWITLYKSKYYIENFHCVFPWMCSISFHLHSARCTLYSTYTMSLNCQVPTKRRFFAYPISKHLYFVDFWFLAYWRLFFCVVLKNSYSTMNFCYPMTDQVAWKIQNKLNDDDMMTDKYFSDYFLLWKCTYEHSEPRFLLISTSRVTFIYCCKIHWKSENHFLRRIASWLHIIQLKFSIFYPPIPTNLVGVSKNVLRSI